MSVEINEINLTSFLEDPAGGVAKFMGEVIAPDVLAIAKEFISRPWPGGGRGARFPAPGPPYKRTGLLRDSLEIVAAPTPAGVEYDIVPTAIRRGVNYGLLLKNGSGKGMTGPYDFMPAEFYV